MAQWIRLGLPFCSPWFESQTHHLRFYKFIFELCHVERDENKQNRHIFKKTFEVAKSLEHWALEDVIL